MSAPDIATLIQDAVSRAVTGALVQRVGSGAPPNGGSDGRAASASDNGRALANTTSPGAPQGTTGTGAIMATLAGTSPATRVGNPPAGTYLGKPIYWQRAKATGLDALWRVANYDCRHHLHLGSGHGQGQQAPRGPPGYSLPVGVRGRSGYR